MPAALAHVGYLLSRFIRETIRAAIIRLRFVGVWLLFRNLTIAALIGMPTQLTIAIPSAGKMPALRFVFCGGLRFNA